MGTSASKATSASQSSDLSQTGTSSAAGEPPAPTKRKIEDINLLGEIFTFAIPTDFDGLAGTGFCENESSSALVNEKIKERDDFIYQICNGKIEIVKTTMKAIEETLASGNGTIDFIYAPYGTVSAKYCRDVNSLFLDFGEPLWSESITTGMMEDGAGYGVEGVFALENIDAMSAVFFNKAVKEKSDSLKNIDFYDYLYTNEWTLDKLLALSKVAASETGACGLISAKGGIAALYFGAGQKYVNRADAENGKSTFTHGFTASAYEVTEKLAEIYADGSTRVLEHSAVKENFKSGEALFACGTLGDINGYYEAKAQFGIMLMPKLSSAQAEYASHMNKKPNILFVIDSGKSAKLMGDFLWAFTNRTATVYSSYCNEYKYFKVFDADSSVIIDEIICSAVFDMAYYNEWADVNEKYISAVATGQSPSEEWLAALGAETEKAAFEYMKVSWQ